jgi:hypothetical protein
MSTLRVGSINSVNGNNALTVAANGELTIPQSVTFSENASFAAGKGIAQNYYESTTLPSNGVWDLAVGQIPSWHTEIVLAFDQLSADSNAAVSYRVYDGSNIETTGYKYLSYYYNAGTPTVSNRNSTDIGFQFYGWESAANVMCGTMTFTRMPSTYYVVTGHAYNEGYRDYNIGLNGRQDSISNADGITGLRIEVGSGTFDSGRVRVFWK